ncbi:MAG: hypothetical protein Q9181_004354 [Wetmoreana brouardii]
MPSRTTAVDQQNNVSCASGDNVTQNASLSATDLSANTPLKGSTINGVDTATTTIAASASSKLDKGTEAKVSDDSVTLVRRLLVDKEPIASFIAKYNYALNKGQRVGILLAKEKHANFFLEPNPNVLLQRWSYDAQEEDNDYVHKHDDDYDDDLRPKHEREQVVLYFNINDDGSSVDLLPSWLHFYGPKGVGTREIMKFRDRTYIHLEPLGCLYKKRIDGSQYRTRYAVLWEPRCKKLCIVFDYDKHGPDGDYLLGGLDRSYTEYHRREDIETEASEAFSGEPDRGGNLGFPEPSDICILSPSEAWDPQLDATEGVLSKAITRWREESSIIRPKGLNKSLRAVHHDISKCSTCQADQGREVSSNV